MKTSWILLSTFALCSFSAVSAQAASVAIMPVQSVNLAEGQGEAIGLFFSNAFARDAHVAVLSPAETKPVWAELRNSAATAQRLGAAQYVELTAIRLASKVTLAGILFASDGKEIFRAETYVLSLDEADAVAARLARALIWRQPVPSSSNFNPSSDTAAAQLPPAVEVPETPPDPTVSHNMFGGKGGLLFPIASGRSISPQVGAQFDVRIGPRAHFMEVGVGVAGPVEDQYATNHLRLTNFFVEIGGSAYLNEGSTGLYIGGGISPGLMLNESYSYDNGSYYYSGSTTQSSGPMIPVYVQLGITFTRDIRTRIYTEVRISQHLLAMDDPTGGSFRPTVLALQMGLGW